jgi:PKD repeat protein
MKKYILKTSLFGLFCFTLTFWACQKDSQVQKSTNELPVLALETNAVNPFTDDRVHLEEGMLAFDDYIAFTEIYNALADLSANPTVKDNCLTSLGIDPLFDDSEVYDYNRENEAPVFPVLMSFETRFNILTERKREALEFKSFLLDGGEPDKFEGSTICDYNLKALLNDKKEIKIGSFIIKYLDVDNIAIISNSDFELLQTVRNTPTTDLKDEGNLFIKDLKNPIKDAIDLFVRDGQGQAIAIKPICNIKFNTTSLANNTFEFINVSTASACGIKQAGFAWDFGDGTTYNGRNPPNHTYNSANYPYTVVLTATCGDCEGKSFSFEIKAPTDPCKTINADFTATRPNCGNGVEFTALGNYNFPAYDFAWDFGDGESESGKKKVTHFYDANISSNKTFDVKLTITKLGCTTPPVTITKKIVVSCGHFYAKHLKTENATISGREWQIAGHIWVQNNVWTQELGSSTRVFKKWAGVWWNKKADNVTADMQGKIIKMVINSAVSGAGTCSDFPIFSSPNAETNSYYVARRPAFPGDGPRFEDNTVFSTHSATISGITINIPQFFLID